MSNQARGFQEDGDGDGVQLASGGGGGFVSGGGSGAGFAQIVADQAQGSCPGGITAIPAQITPPGLFDPTNFFADFATGNPNVQAFWKVPCINGGSTIIPCWIPITCIQVNVGSYNSWWDSIWDGFSNTSLKRNVVIQKWTDRASPDLWRSIKRATGSKKMTIVLVRKIPVPAGTPQPCQLQGSGGGQGCGTGGGSGCTEPKCQQRGRCCCRQKQGCFDQRGPQNEDCEWKRRFPFRQSALVITMYCARITGVNMYAGNQCQSPPGGCSLQCAAYPSPFDASNYLGGPGLAGTGRDWQVKGGGPNFPEPPSTHGLRPIGKEQYQIQWSSLSMRIEQRNPINGCRYFDRENIVPV